MAAARLAQPLGWRLDRPAIATLYFLHGRFFEGLVFTLLLSSLVRSIGAAWTAAAFFQITTGDFTS